MSLLSNRGRFSKPEKSNNLLKDMENSSVLSSRGTNPNSLFKFEKKYYDYDNKHQINKTQFNNANKIIKKFDDNFVDNKFITKHYDYENDLKPSIVKKKNNIALIIVMFVVEIFTLFGIAGLGTFIRVSNMTQKVSFDKTAVQNTNIDASTLAVMKGYKTVAIFGVDSRTGSVDKGNNSDVNIIANLNLETGDVQLVSVYRDLYLSITDQNAYDKLNAAYRKGGPQAAVKAINKNFDLNIENFFSFNWKAVADGIELLGGIDLEISKSEYKYMNAFIHETCIATGIDAKNPAAHYISGMGMQHLDGVQVVAYGRLRLMDSDFQRVERQKKVIALCLQKAKKLDIAKLRLIMEAVLPQIAYEFDMDEMLSILRIVKQINIVASCGVPETNNIVTMDMGNSGDSVVPLNLEKAVITLHKLFFDKDNYSVSMAVKRYSNRISELRQKYQEENKVKASIKASEEEASRLSTLKPKKASRSTVSKVKRSSKSNVDTDPNRMRDDNDDDIVPIMEDDTIYEDEPEEDNTTNEVDDNTNNLDDRNDNNSIAEVNSPPKSNENGTKNLNIDDNNINETMESQNNAPVSYDSPGDKKNDVVQKGPNSNSSYENVTSNGPVNSPGEVVSPSGNNLNKEVQYKVQSNGVVVDGPPTG